MKDQEIRLLDVFVLGPLMVRSGWLNREESPLVSIGMMIGGAATIFYNYQNYLEKEKEKHGQSRS